MKEKNIQTKSSRFKKRIVPVSVLVIVIAISLTLITRSGKRTASPEHPTDTVKQNGSEIESVGYQQPSFNVDVWAKFSEPGFIVIYDQENGNWGNLLGVSDLLMGQTGQTTIDTEGKASLGDTLTAVLYKDDGDEVFDPNTDKVITDTSGAPIMRSIFIEDLSENY